MEPRYLGCHEVLKMPPKNEELRMAKEKEDGV
jgi:hypothetical protein